MVSTGKNSVDWSAVIIRTYEKSRNMKKIILFLIVSTLLLFGCNSNPKRHEKTSFKSETSDSSTEETNVLDSALTFNNEEDLWRYLTEKYDTVTMDDIKSGNYTDSYVIINSVAKNVENETDLEYVSCDMCYEQSNGECFMDDEIFFYDDASIKKNGPLFGKEDAQNMQDGDQFKICAYVYKDNSFGLSKTLAIQKIDTVENDLKTAKNDTIKPKENTDDETTTVIPSKHYAVKYGTLLDANPEGGSDGKTLVIKAKITGSATNDLTVKQNYFNVADIIHNQGGNEFNCIDYWAVADMTSGSEEKVVAFTISKDVIDMVYANQIADNQIGEYADDLYIHSSLQ